jgi:hypothetical protein
MLARVQRLERARCSASPFERDYGSLEAFEEAVRAGIEAGKLDRRDMLGESGDGGVLRAIRSWHERGVFGKLRCLTFGSGYADEASG